MPAIICFCFPNLPVFVLCSALSRTSQAERGVCLEGDGEPSEVVVLSY